MGTTINILYCIEYLGAGGTEKQLMALIDGLDRKKFKPHVCCLRELPQALGCTSAVDFKAVSVPKIQLKFSSFTKLNTLSEILRLVRFIKTNKIQIIQSYFQDPVIMGLIAGKITGVRHMVACFRDLGFWRKNESDLKMRLAYQWCSAYIANSIAVKDAFVKAFGLRENRISVIYNGIDARKFKRDALKPPTHGVLKRVGIVANFNRRVKRLDVFVKAAACVARELEAVEFVIAGDGELKEELVALARDLGILEKLTFCGTVLDVPQFLTTVDVGVLTSDSEGFSNTVLEYMAAGVPVVATAVGGNNEMIVDGKNGFLVPAGDYATIGKKIVELLTLPDLANVVIENAVALVRSKYSIEACIANYEKWYEQVIGQRC